MRSSHLPSARRSTRGAAAASVLVAGLLLLTACSGDDESSGHTGGASTADLDDVQDDYGIPEECRDAYPFVVDRATLDDVPVVPADWPEPPVEATLCKAETNADDTTGFLGYATDVSPDEVLAAYEEALVGFELDESDGSDQLTGRAGTTLFAVVPADGAIMVSFAAGS